MDYEAILSQVIALLQRERRIAYRVLKRQMQLDDDLLEDGISDAIVDENFFLPRAVTVRLAELRENISDLSIERFLEIFWRDCEAWLDHRGVVFDAEVWVGIFVAKDPALAFGDDLIAELFARDHTRERPLLPLQHGPAPPVEQQLPGLLPARRHGVESAGSSLRWDARSHPWPIGVCGSSAP